MAVERRGKGVKGWMFTVVSKTEDQARLIWFRYGEKFHHAEILI
ncbi:hypothetical protein [Leptolyngbya sp. NK1-12]|nr:hypothetical protein [Leptolyngbya sp. NK1-12]